MPSLARSFLISVLALVVALPALAQDGSVPRITISAIERGEAQGMGYLEGAALEPEPDGSGFLFSDGTGVIRIHLEEKADEGGLPLFEMIGIEGTSSADGIEVSSWTRLRIMTPAVIVEEPQVVDAFWSWIIAYGSQAPRPAE